MSAPSSEIYLLSNGNQLTADMHHTYRFTSASEQRTFFGIGTDGGMVKRFTPTQYIRVSENEVKVPYPKEAIDGRFSYMAIRTVQPNVEERIWYAFIVDLEYISDMATKITFKIDPIQTFLFGGGAEMSWAHVERCHQSTDAIGDNRVAEPFSAPSYVANEVQNDYFNSGCIIGIVRGTGQVYAAGQTITTEPKIYYGNSIASGSQFFGYNLSNTGQLSELLRMLESLKDEDGVITDFYYCPWEIMENSVGAGYEMQNEAVEALIPQISIHVNGSGSTQNKLENYTPKNNKLFTYPYNVFAVNNTSGNEMLLKFEEFTNNTPTLRKEGTWLAKPSCSIIPTNYEKESVNYRYGISLNDYPLFSYASNAYNTWLAQKSQSEIIPTAIKGIIAALMLTEPSALSALAATAGAVLPPAGLAVAGVGVATSFAVAVANIGADVIEAKNKPDKIVQDINGGTMSIGNNRDGFRYSRLSINGYYAEIIDNYFTQYGYAQDKLINVQNWIESNIRTRFKYIKTTDAHINGSCPARYKDELETVFNRGITFWEKNQTIGDYSSDNPVVS